MNLNHYPDTPDCDRKHDECCAQLCYQYADVSIPLELFPETELGHIETECCGEPVIQCEHEPCCSNCNIIITQSVKIKIPVKVGIKTKEGNSFIQCGDGCCK